MKKIIVVVLIGWIIVLAGIALFFWEPQQFRWHWRHGFHADVYGMRFRIPWHYHVENVSADGSTIISGHARNFSTDPARWHYGAIFLSKGLLEPEDPHATLPPNSSFVKTGDRTLVLAGVQGKCSEYEGLPTKSGDHTLGTKTIVIQCSFRNRVDVMFDGTPPAVADFYAIIGSAETIRERAR